MGQRFIENRIEKYPFLNFTSLWAGSKISRYMKRRLSKARRRSWKDPRGRGLAGVESECNWKGW